MKKILCILTAALLLGCTASAETNIIANPQLIIEMITPSPSPEPAGETYATEDLIVTLPAGMTILSAQERAGYDAAVSFDYPSAGQAVLLAVDAKKGASLAFSILESSQTASAAANEAALSIPGAEEAQEIILGENSFSTFRHTLGEDEMRLFFLSDGERLLCVGACGLEDEQINAMLAGLIF